MPKFTGGKNLLNLTQSRAIEFVEHKEHTKMLKNSSEKTQRKNSLLPSAIFKELPLQMVLSLRILKLNAKDRGR